MSKSTGEFSIRRNFRCRWAMKTEQLVVCKLTFGGKVETRLDVNQIAFGCGEAAEDRASWKFRQNVGAASAESENLANLRKKKGRSIVVHS